MRPTPRARAALVIATMTLTLAACGGSGSAGGSGGPGGSASPDDGSGIAHPTGASDLVLAITYEGGMLRPDMVFGQLPPLTIAGDGTVILQGAQIAIFPGPALPAVMSRRLSEAGLQLVLERIAETGFFAESATFTEESLTLDAPLTVFTLHADGREVVVKVGALGSYRTPQEMPPTMTERERQAHLALAPLYDNLTQLDQLIPASAWEETDWHDYRAESLRLLVANVDGEPADPSGIPGGIVEWPTDGDAATFGDPYPILEGARCGTVSGADAERWYEVLAQANQLVRFSSGDHTYQVTPRPLLPGDLPDCVVAQPAG
ncbi:MAG: hypothetical protein ABI622_04935 [Chloroflexota bacterium]